MIEIVVDDRERAGGLAEALRRVMHREIRVARLALGDVAIGAALRVERKAAADFVASLAGGRLERQLAAQLRARGRTLLIVEGEFSPAALGGLAPEAVRGAILGVQLDLRIPVLRSRDVEDTARWIAALARREEKTAGGAAFGGTSLSALPFQSAPPPPPRGPLAGHSPRRRAPAARQSVAAAELARLPGLGPRKAEALLEHFGTLQAIRAATVETLAAAPGIGPALAAAIHRRFHLG